MLSSAVRAQKISHEVLRVPSPCHAFSQSPLLAEMEMCSSQSHSACQTTLVVLCPVLVSAIQERHRQECKGGPPQRWSPPGWRSCPLRRDWRGWSCSPWRREDSGGTSSSCSSIKGLLQRGQRLCLSKEPHGEGKGQCVQVVLGEVSSQYNKVIFYSEKNHSLE